jgi:hypothetical protein
MVIAHTVVLFIAAFLVGACTSLEGTGARVETLTTDVRDGTVRVAAVTARGAEAIGDSVGTAYRGVKQGYEEPESQAYGPAPRNYASTIRRHMLQFERVSRTASFSFGQPVKGYLNKGLIRGGEIEWQGWLVDLQIASTSRLGQPQVDEYVVSMKDGEILEVIEKDHAGAFQRVPSDRAPVPAAPRR